MLIALVLGSWGAAYVLGTTVVMGVVPREELIKSTAPFSDAARIMWGNVGAIAVSIAVIVSSIGALNGWTLLMGQVPMAAARDGLFPPLFARLSARGVPAAGIVTSALLATVLILLQAMGSEGFSAFYKLVVGLSTMTAVSPLCILCACRLPGLGTPQQWGASPPCHDCGNYCLCLRHVHALRMRGRACSIRHSPAAPRHTRFRLAA